MTPICSIANRDRRLRARIRDLQRGGKVLVLLAILMPTLFGIVGLIIDGGLMMDEHRQLQHASDAAATAAAMDLRLGNGSAVAKNTAVSLIQSGSRLSDADVIVHIPPANGPYTGQEGHVEVIAQRDYQSRFMQVLDGIVDRSIQARTVAGVEGATSGGAIVVLDPDPADVSYATTVETASAVAEDNVAEDGVSQSGATAFLAAIPIVGPEAASLVDVELPDLLRDVVNSLLNNVITNAPTAAAPTLTAGLEIEGSGRLIVDGAILVNNQWGGVDENGEPAGSAPGPPYGVACMPVPGITQVLARDLRVVGGVDNPNNYLPYDPDEPNPLQANRLAVPDPLQNHPVPSVTSDPANVNPTVHDPADLCRVIIPAADAAQLAHDVLNQLPAPLQPLFQPQIAPLTQMLTQAVIEPGVYNSISVFAPDGGARFEPGVYIIRGTNPDTNLSLCIIGPIEAEGVLFYITDSATYDPFTGLPDAAENSNTPPANPVPSLAPSAWVMPLRAGARISGLVDSGSPFHGMLIHQRRTDRRPIIIEAQQIIGSGEISGTVYAKWGHTSFAGGAGSYDLRFASGTMRVVTVADTTFAPTRLFPPAQDVFLLE